MARFKKIKEAMAPQQQDYSKHYFYNHPKAFFFFFLLYINNSRIPRVNSNYNYIAPCNSLNAHDPHLAPLLVMASNLINLN